MFHNLVSVLREIPSILWPYHTRTHESQNLCWFLYHTGVTFWYWTWTSICTLNQSSYTLLAVHCSVNLPLFQYPTLWPVLLLLTSNLLLTGVGLPKQWKSQEDFAFLFTSFPSNSLYLALSLTVQPGLCRGNQDYVSVVIVLTFCHSESLHKWKTLQVFPSIATVHCLILFMHKIVKCILSK